jgi:hypothetical protein
MSPAAFRALVFLCLALVGCESATEKHDRIVEQCGEYCSGIGMTMTGLAGRGGCICAVDRPITCDTAWTRADAALDLLGDCRAALLECSTRGGR